MTDIRTDALAKSTAGLGVSEAQLERERMAMNEKNTAYRPNFFNDEESRNVLKSISRTFKKFELAKRLIMSEGERMKRYANDRLLLSSDICTYSKILDGLIMKEENLLDKQGLSFDYIEFLDEMGKDQIHNPMMQGRMFITNFRFILITCEQLKGTILSRSNTSKARREIYEISSYLNDEVHYKSITLDEIADIEIHSRTGGRAETELRSKKRHFRPWKSKEKWGYWKTAREGVEYSEKVLVISSNLRPFDERCLINIHVDENMDIGKLASYAAFLQRNCLRLSEMIPRMMSNEEVDDFKKMYDTLPLIKKEEKKENTEEEKRNSSESLNSMEPEQSNEREDEETDRENNNVEYVAREPKKVESSKITDSITKEGNEANNEHFSNIANVAQDNLRFIIRNKGK
ncbi:DgyrCDS10940 [Dimorphilus gyrociliatus]|uniref:DgyrCDS10940 n=1 Tax=Dimorphilus gyrociliatus TaxID=2664684 RepID=A0A7I8W1V0_9ANNE|nr:DgyrCDS10940 [Dimorphilus gyrociliatus]